MVTFTTIQQIRDVLEDEGGVPPDTLLGIVNFLWDNIGGPPSPLNIPVLASVRGEWHYEDGLTGPPADGALAFDTADPNVSTVLRVDMDDRHNDQFRGVLTRLNTGWFLYIQEDDDPQTHVIVKVTGPITDHGGYVSVPVDILTHGTNTGPWDDLLVTIIGPIATMPV